MTKESEQLLNSHFELQRRLSTVLPKEIIDYIIELIVLDQAHKNYLKLDSDIS